MGFLCSSNLENRFRFNLHCLEPALKEHIPITNTILSDWTLARVFWWLRHHFVEKEPDIHCFSYVKQCMKFTTTQNT